MEVTTTKTVPEPRSRTMSGVVVSTKMKDTIVVTIDRFVKHTKYQKYFKTTKRFKVHDPGNTKKVGEKVTIIECRPISKDKRFKLVPPPAATE